MLPAEPMEQHLSRLRRAIAQTSEPLMDEARSLALGVPDIDAALGGGLACAALHDLSAAPMHLGAAAGFAFALAARAGGALGVLLRHKPSCSPSAARTRWEIAACPSVPDELGGLGRTAFRLSLLRNRRGPCGTWTLTWDHHERVFSALSVGMAAEAPDRPDRAALSA